MAIEVECVLDARAAIGESPVWCPEEAALYWVDIPGRALHRFDPATGLDRRWDLGQEIGCFALRRQGAGSVLAAMRHGYHLLDPGTGALEPLFDPEPDLPDNRFNDGAVDPRGRFWAGTMSMVAAEEPRGSLYRLDAERRCARVAGGFWTINGLASSPDGRTMYASDSDPRVRTIWAFDFDPDDGVATGLSVFATTHDLAGRPDGGATDADGCYWMAGVGGWQLVRFAPTGTVDRVIDLPVEKPTKVAFGGPGLDVMHVTSIRGGITPGTEGRQPQARGLFAVRGAGVSGLPPARFAG